MLSYGPMRRPCAILLAVLLGAQGAPASAMVRAVPVDLAAKAPAVRTALATAQFANFRAEFMDRMLSFRPELKASLGLPLGPKPLSELTPEASNRFVEFLTDAQTRLQSLPPAESLAAADQVDHAVLRTVIRSQIHYARDLRSEREEVGAGGSPYGLAQMLAAQAREGESGASDWRDILAILESAPGYLEVARENLRRGAAEGVRIYRPFVEREGVAAAIEAARYFGEELPGKARAALGAGSELLPRIERAAAAAAEAQRRHAEFIREEILPKAGESYALGEEEYAWRLANELGVSETPAELEAKGRSLAARIRARMEELAAKIAPGKPLPELMAELRADHPADDAELIRLYEAAADRARDFVTARGLFELPASYRISVVPTPVAMRSSIASAAYFPAPPLAAEKKGVFLVTPSAGAAGRLQVHNRAKIPTTAVHEAFPGHDLQFHYFQKSRISPARYLLELAGYAFSFNVEGYAHYAEELMRANGFFSPKEELAQLGAQLWRAWRIALDAGLHSGRVSLAEVARTLQEEAFLPESQAKTEAYRYAKQPTQALTYLLGRLEIEKLKEEYRREAGLGYREREFHKLFLGFGPVLPSLMRPALLAAARKARRGAVALRVWEAATKLAWSAARGLRAAAGI